MQLFNLQAIKQKYYTYGFFIVYFIIGIFIFNQYGIGWDDECSRIDTGYINLRYMYFNEAKPLLEGNEKYHGPFFEIILIGIEKVFFMKDTAHIYAMRHGVMFLLFYVSIIAFFCTARKLFNDKYALLACLFLILSPRIFAESFYNTKDVGLLAMFNFALYGYIKFFETKSYKWAVLHGYFTGFLIAVRIIGIVIPIMTTAYFIIWLIMNRKAIHKLPLIAVYLGTTILVMILCWPVMWEGPWHHFQLAFLQMKHYHWDGEVFYLGKQIKATQLPWHYLPLWILITTPILYLLLFFAGIGFYCQQFFRSGIKPFFDNLPWNSIIALFIFPILSVILLKSVIYDGWRHLYFIYPLLILVAVFGLQQVYKMFANQQYAKTIITSIILIHCMYISIWTLKNHPFQQVYFNSVSQIVFKPMLDHFELDYWGVSYKQALQHLLNNEKRQLLISIENFPGSLNAQTLNQNQRSFLSFTKSGADSCDYYLTNYRGCDKHPKGQVIKQFFVDDIPIMGIYKR
jgi:hypothetical protein